MSIDKVILASKRQAADNIHVAYLKELYNKVELIDDDPDFLNCIKISIDSGIESNLEVIFNILASKLTHENKIAKRIAQNENVIFVETN